MPFAESADRQRLTPAHRRLFAFLAVATFFEGYDFLAIGQLLPNVRSEFGLTETQGGLLLSAVGIGTLLSYGVVRLADRIGRRRVMLITILGYALATFLTGLSRSATEFALSQLVARIFLIAEWSLSMVYAAEEFPADRRGRAIGIIQAANALGGVACAATVPLLLEAPYGWRTVYFVGVVPLLLLAYARRGLGETKRFAAYAAAELGERRATHVMRSPYRGRVYQLAAIWGLVYMCAQPAVFFWKEFAVAERGMSDAQVGWAIALASIVSLPALFLVGRIFDGWGRRPAAALLLLGFAFSVVGAYRLHSVPLLTVCLAGVVFCVSATFSVLDAFTTELFPTEKRAEAFAWANNLLGRVGFVLAPAIVAALAGHVGWGHAVSVVAACPLVALVLVLRVLPETRGRELEETARLGA
jgi:MFS transporter, putative metabolite:H+ symporter